MLCAMRRAVMPASVSRRACVPAAVTVAAENACAARLWLAQVSEAKKLVSANSRI